MSNVQVVPPGYDKNLGGNKSWSLNPSALWGDDIIVLEEENIAAGTPAFTRYVDLADFSIGTKISVDINNGTSNLTAKLYLTNKPGTDLTSLDYYQEGTLPNLTADGTWTIKDPTRAIKIEVDATAGADADCYIYASRR
jgi:hypothetical protein